MKKRNKNRGLAKVAKTEKKLKKLEPFLKTESGKKFIGYLHKERIDVLCKRFHLSYLLCTNSTHTLNLVLSTMKKLNIKPEKNIKKNVELDYSHHKQPVLLPKKVCEKYIIHHLTRKELINGYKVHKLDKWLIKNPEPVEQDATGQLNMFYESNHTDWKKNLDGIKIKIEDQIIRKYNPNLTIIGRYRVTEDHYAKPPYTVSEDKYIEKPICTIEDKENTARFISFLTEDKGIVKKAKEIIEEEKRKDDRLICGYLRDHDNKIGRSFIAFNLAA